jgi:hypothetical protein
MIRHVYDADNECALLKFNGPYLLPSFGPSFIGAEPPRTAYDADNERAILKFNGPYRLPSRDHLVITERGSQVIYSTKIIKAGNVKVYGILPRNDYGMEGNDAQKD